MFVILDNYVCMIQYHEVYTVGDQPLEKESTVRELVLGAPNLTARSYA